MSLSTGVRDLTHGLCKEGGSLVLEPHAETIQQGQGGWDFFPHKNKNRQSESGNHCCI